MLEFTERVGVEPKLVVPGVTTFITEDKPEDNIKEDDKKKQKKDDDGDAALAEETKLEEDNPNKENVSD